MKAKPTPALFIALFLLSGCAPQAVQNRSPATVPASETATKPYSGMAHHIVFVIDTSGSMALSPDSGSLPPYEVVRTKVAAVLSYMREEQDFHMIFYSRDTPPLELHERRLVSATAEHKRAAMARMGDMVLQGGQTNCVPALARAFDVLAAADARPGKTIFIVTDGDLGDMDQVRKFLDKRNAKHDVQVTVFLVGAGNDPDVVKALRELADRNGGKFRHYSEPE